jgi:hypothetical protein
LTDDYDKGWRRIRSIGKDIEKLESLCIADRNVKWCSQYRRQVLWFFKKLNIETWHWWLMSILLATWEAEIRRIMI